MMCRWVQSTQLCCNFHLQFLQAKIEKAQTENQSFSKVALDDKDDKDFCVSDDLVFEFDCNATSGCGVHD